MLDTLGIDEGSKMSSHMSITDTKKVTLLYIYMKEINMVLVGRLMLIAGYFYRAFQLALLKHRRLALRSAHACWWWSKMVFIRPPLIILILFNYLISCFHLKRCFWFAWWPQPAFNLDIERSCDCYDSANRRFRSWKALQTFSAHKF